ncbi:hypothetical protein BT96DRAFT_1008714 [Gymnopus androsaceus JB14]|uniref:Ribonuclease H1 N-terminal domain-containing protein n=1 Tax=Gymnopus androsaceus JB14 TaxID=1447944 RepID=A0A6A4GEQ2_9AGAR|nr:hypothetical protein BT96DRAFT_1008714 [Gymnopus androsaceus JB14]
MRGMQPLAGIRDLSIGVAGTDLSIRLAGKDLSIRLAGNHAGFIWLFKPSPDYGDPPLPSTNTKTQLVGATKIQIFTEDRVTITVIPICRSATAPIGLESSPIRPSAIAPDSEHPPTRESSTQTDLEPHSTSSTRHSDESTGPYPYPLTISRPLLMIRPPFVEPGQLYHVIYAGARVGIFGDWSEQVQPYVEGIAGVHWESFTTYEAALGAYTDAYNREEYSPLLKIVQHPNLEESRIIGEARIARRHRQALISAS